MLDEAPQTQENGELLMLHLQIEELTAMLVQEREAHAKASVRATAAERRNAVLRNQIREMESDMAIAAQCWGCDRLGDHDFCEGCTNSAVFIQEGKNYRWRGKK